MRTRAALDAALVLGASLRLTRLVTTDDLGKWAVRQPAYAWASQGDRPLPDFDGVAERDSLPGPEWRWRAVSGLDCPFCVGYWVGAAVLASSALLPSDGRARGAWRLVAGSLALNYVVGHASARLD